MGGIFSSGRLKIESEFKSQNWETANPDSEGVYFSWVNSVYEYELIAC